MILQEIKSKTSKYMPQLSTARAHRSYIDQKTLNKNNRKTKHTMTSYWPKIPPKSSPTMTSGNNNANLYVDCFPFQDKNLIKYSNGKIFPDMRSYYDDQPSRQNSYILEVEKDQKYY